MGLHTMRYIKNYSMREWSRFDIDTQEIMCKKYNIRLTDYKSASEKRKILMQKIIHILWLMLLQSFQALKAYNTQPTKRKQKI